MHIEQFEEYLKTQLELRPSSIAKEVLLRIAGRDYAVRGIYAGTSHIIIEGGEDVTSEATAQGHMAAPAGPEGEGVEPAPPKEIQEEMDERRTKQ